MSPKSSPVAASARRMRPPDRRAQVIDAAAVAFAAHGFPGTSMAQIARDADISAPALYRHFATKSALLGAVVRQSAQRLQHALDSVPPTPDDPVGELGRLIDALVTEVLNHRRYRDLYRWESGALDLADRDEARRVRQSATRRVHELIAATAPTPTGSDTTILAGAVFAVIGSPSTHRIALPRKAIAQLIGDAARTVAQARPVSSPEQTAGTGGLVPTARREIILSEAAALFAAHGFHEVTIEQIGAATGLTASGVYRHFSSKQAILAAALERAAERTAAALATGLAQTDSRSEALAHLTQEYARLCVANPAIVTVYRRSFGALGDVQRAELRRRQRITVDEWAGWLRDTRPELPWAAARFLVHAALDVMHDLTCGPQPVGAETAAGLALIILLETPARGMPVARVRS